MIVFVVMVAGVLFEQEHADQIDDGPIPAARMDGLIERDGDRAGQAHARHAVTRAWLIWHAPRRKAVLEKEKARLAVKPIGLERKFPATCYSPTSKPRSTLAAEALHYRVRNGNGCYLLAMITGKGDLRPKPEKET